MTDGLKKRVIAGGLALLLALALIPVTAKETRAAGGFPKKTEITLEGMKLSEWPASDKVAYDEATGTLTFDNYQPKDSAYTKHFR